MEFMEFWARGSSVLEMSIGQVLAAVAGLIAVLVLVLVLFLAAAWVVNFCADAEVEVMDAGVRRSWKEENWRES